MITCKLADEYASGVPKDETIAIFKYNENGNLTPESMGTFSDVLAKDLHGNLPGSYDATRPKSSSNRDMLRSSFSIKAKEGFKYWEIERPKPTKCKYIHEQLSFLIMSQWIAQMQLNN